VLPSCSQRRARTDESIHFLSCLLCKFNCNPEFVQSLFSLVLSPAWTITSSRARFLYCGQYVRVVAYDSGVSATMTRLPGLCGSWRGRRSVRGISSATPPISFVSRL
jgi:hypothetical protein